MSSTYARMRYRLSPAALNTFYRCPRSFHLKYLQKGVRPLRTFSEALVLGAATHKALHRHFCDVLSGRPPLPAETYAARAIRDEHYPADRALELRAAHLPIVVEHMQRALAALPSPSTVIHSEKEFGYRFRPEQEAEAIALVSRIDLVLQHPDGTVDHIDFKTGKGSGGDPIQNLVSRLAVASHFAEPANGGVEGERLRTVIVSTGSGQCEVVPVGREHHRHTWEVVREIVITLRSESEWRPRPDPGVCRWCDFAATCDAAEHDPDV